MTAAEQAHQLRTDYKRTFDSPEGRRVLSDLARFCNIGFAFGVKSEAQMVYGIECMRQVFWHVHDMVYREVEPRKAPTFDFSKASPFKEYAT